MAVKLLSPRKLEEVLSAIIPMLPPRQQLYFWKKLPSYWRRPVSLSRKATIIVVLLLMQGCGLFKKSTTKKVIDQYASKVQEHAKLDAFNTGQTDQRFFEWRVDSLNRSSVLQIWPKGSFTFSPNDGFEGEAEKILVISNVQKSVAALKLKDSLATYTDRLKTENTFQKTEKKQHKDILKMRTPAFWLVIGLGMMTLAGVFIYKFLNK